MDIEVTDQGRWKGVRLLRIPPYLTMRDLHGRKHYSALDCNRTKRQR